MPALRLRRVQAVCRSDRRRRRDQPLPARRRRRHRRAVDADRTARRSARSCARRAHAVRDRAHRRGVVHRLHAVHRCVSGRCDRRRGETHAHGAACALHGLRALPAALPRRLHRHDAGATRVEPAGRARRARALRGAQLRAKTRAGKSARASFRPTAGRRGSATPSKAEVVAAAIARARARRATARRSRPLIP